MSVARRDTPQASSGGSSSSELIYNTLKDNEIVFGLHYFPHHFRDKSPYFHYILVEDGGSSRNAYQAPRGSAKSTILVFNRRTHRICFKKKRFIVLVQNTYKKAVSTLEGIKDEFRYNDRLVRDFRVTLEKDAEGDTIFRHPDGFRTRVLCKGVEQIGAVRGEKFGAYRPDDIVGDDMEDDEMVKSPERRQGLKDLFNNALIPAGDVKTLNVDIIGTILHDDSLMADLVSLEKYKEYRKLFFIARSVNKVNGERESLWPERWSVADLDEFEKNNPEAFAKEMQGDPSSGSLETIQREDFRRWAEVDNGIVLYNSDGSEKARWSWKDCRAAVGIDLAWEENKANDFSVFFPGIITPSNDLLLDTYIFKKGMRPNEWEDNAFMLDEKYSCLTGRRVCFGFEKSKLEKVMKWFLREAMKRRNKFLLMKAISWGTQDKIERFYSRMANRYAQHSVYHKAGLGIYENQAIRLRSTAHDDHCDAAGMLPELLQHASYKEKPQAKKDVFSFLQKQTPLYRERNKTPYRFGQRTSVPFFKVKQGI